MLKLFTQCSRLMSMQVVPRLASTPSKLFYCTVAQQSQPLSLIKQEKHADEPDDLFRSIEIECRSTDTAVLNSYESFVLSAAQHLDITVSRTWTPTRIFWRRTLLKSVHIDKRARVQYEIRTNFRCFELDRITGSTADTFLEYIQRNLPEGVAMKVTKRKLEALPEYLKQRKSRELE